MARPARSSAPSSGTMARSIRQAAASFAMATTPSSRSWNASTAAASSTTRSCLPPSNRALLAHNHPKLSCAERIVLARIEEVRVGVDDLDPTVDRKGIKYAVRP